MIEFSFVLRWPQMIWLMLSCLVIIQAARKHGTLREEPYHYHNVWRVVMEYILMNVILWWGGWYG
jgi:hypothetical protein